jgi:hypothetical protein
MSLFIEGLVTFLSNSGTAAADRVFPMKVPQGEELPCITYKLISDPGEPTHSGPSSLRHPRFQLDCWGNNYLEAATLADEVISRMDGYKGLMGGTLVHASFLEDARDNHDPETGRHWLSVDVIIWQKKPV